MPWAGASWTTSWSAASAALLQYSLYLHGLYDRHGVQRPLLLFVLLARAALVPADVTEAEVAGSASGDGSEPDTDDGRQVPLSHPLPRVPTGVP